MPHYLQMTEDAYGSPNGRTVYRYRAGSVYSAASTPPVDAFLAHSFVSSGRAVVCDAEGTVIVPDAKPATKGGKSVAPAAPSEPPSESEPARPAA